MMGTGLDTDLDGEEVNRLWGWSGAVPGGGL